MFFIFSKSFSQDNSCNHFVFFKDIEFIEMDDSENGPQIPFSYKLVNKKIIKNICFYEFMIKSENKLISFFIGVKNNDTFYTLKKGKPKLLFLINEIFEIDKKIKLPPFNKEYIIKINNNIYNKKRPYNEKKFVFTFYKKNKLNKKSNLKIIEMNLSISYGIIFAIHHKEFGLCY